MDEKSGISQSEILSEKEIRRYARQIEITGLGIYEQEKIKKSKILVIGAGGKGSSVLQNLTSVGTGTLGICDNYHVTEEQLIRQHLFGDGDLGKQRAIISREKLQKINQSVVFHLHNVFLTEKNIDQIVSAYDIFIDATDNFNAHCLINYAAIRLNKPLVYGNVDGVKGYVSVFNYKGGPSFMCCFPKPPAESKEIKNDSFVCQLTLYDMVGTIMANEAVKIITGTNTTLSGNLLGIDVENYQFSLKAIEKNPENFIQ